MRRLASSGPRRHLATAVPGNETQLHFRCKEHIAAQLAAAPAASRRLLIGLRCVTRQGGAAVAPYWTCTERRTALLTQDWARVATEHSVAGVGRFDVALLGGRGQLLAALEVFHKGPVSSDKMRRLRRRAVRWAEVRGAPELYEGPHRWSVARPLPAFRAPFKPFECARCAQGWADVRFTHVSAMCDVYPRHSRVSTRYVFGEFHTPSGPVQVETGFRSFRGVVDEEREALLLCAGPAALPTPSLSFSPIARHSLSHMRANPALVRRLAELRATAAAFDVLVPPPGLSLPAVLAQDEHLQFDLRAIRTPMMLFPTLRRLYPNRFHWDFGTWRPGGDV